ncbi:MAG TPA: S41 family peptidase [Magnetovibrio sp.]
MSACAPSATLAPTLAPNQQSAVGQPTGSPDERSSTTTARQTAPDDSFDYRAAENTVREGLRSIILRYIDPIDLNDLALSALHGLSTIDPNLHLELDTTRHELQLSLRDNLLARMPTPHKLDANAWARLSSDVLFAARAHSTDLQSADNERVYEAMFDGMLSSLDVFSRYAGATEARAHRARREGFGGIGIRFTKAEDGILITHVSDKGPAMEAGVKPGDVIVRVNDDQMQGLKLRSVAELLRGPVGSLISLSVTRLGTEAGAPQRKIDFSLKRSHIVPETVRVAMDDGLMVINISSFNKNTSSTLHDILRVNAKDLRLGKIKGVVIDLRGNPGGLLSQAVNVADLFLDKGRIIATHGRHPDSHHEYSAGGVDLTGGTPLAVLIDGDSASAAEIVASALQDLGRAVVVGTTSYGKGTVQTVIRLPNDGEMTLTWSRFISPSGYAIHGLGVMPAVCATNTTVPSAPGMTPGMMDDTNDESLTAAILAPEHIDAGRNAMDAWRASGLIFDGRRGTLRGTCPAKVFKPQKNGDFLLKLAERVVTDPTVYQRAMSLSQPVNTASR